MLAVLIFFFPTLFGEGYESIKALSSTNPGILMENTILEKFKSNEWVLLAFIGVTMMIKSVATGLTLGSGGNGGNFAPSLFVGSYLGYFVAKFFLLPERYARARTSVFQVRSSFCNRFDHSRIALALAVLRAR